MKRLHELLQLGQRAAIAAVEGMGGAGKTELAIQYATRHQEDYPGGICWFGVRETNPAAQILAFAQSRLNLEVPQELGGKRLEVEEQVSWCWENWRPSEGLVLVVLDDLTDLADCLPFLPEGTRFRVLITTRLRDLDPGYIQEIPLDVLSPEEALQLLKALVGQERVEREAEKARELCAWLGYLPLGLQLVGSYLAKKPHWSLAKMLERLEAQKLDNEALDLTEERRRRTLSTAEHGVRAAFQLSWQELEPATQEVARLSSLLAGDIFLWEWIESAAEKLDWPDSVDSVRENAIVQLYERHLLQPVQAAQPAYKFHPLIRQFLQEKLPESAQASNFKQAVAATMVEIAKEITEFPTKQQIESLQIAIPHLAEVAQNLTDALLSDDDLIQPFLGLGRFYESQGLYGMAEPWLEQCLSTARDRLKDDHPCVTASLNNLALLYYNQGRYVEAEPLYLQALELSLLGDDHPDVADSLNNLALLYKSQGRYAEAEPLYLQALELRERFLGDNHPDVANSLSNLAGLYESQGRYAEAEPLYLLALELKKSLLGEDHPYVANSLDGLAQIYHSQGRYSEAEPLCLQALQLRKRLLGDDHPDVAFSLNNLALLYCSQGRYVEAEPLYLQALELRKRLLGDDHPEVATSLNNLAALYSFQRRYAEAEPLYLQALESEKRLLGDDHPNVATSLNNLAALYYSQGRYAEAEPLYLQALELRKRLLGDDHPHVATSLNNLTLLYHSQGRYAEAEPLYLQALQLSVRVLGSNHPQTITIVKRLVALRIVMWLDSSWLGRLTKIPLLVILILLALLWMLLLLPWKLAKKLLALVRRR